MTTTKPRRSKNRLLLQVLSFGLNVAIAFVCFLNIQPYIGAVEYLFAEISQDSALVQWLMLLPVIGSVMGWFGALFNAVVGFFIWAIFQVLELLPQLAKGDRDNLERVSQNLAKFPVLSIESRDQEWIRQAKSTYNATPAKWYSVAVLVSCVAYLVDFVFCGLYYPPLQGGWQSMGLFLAAPTLNDIDWKNLALLIVTLFAVEVAFWLANFIKSTYAVVSD